MRSTLKIVILAAMVAVVLTGSTAQASILSDLFWGRHREYVDPGINIAVDEYLPQEWANHSDLMFRYHSDENRIFAGTTLEVGVLVTTKDIDDAEFAICISDPDMAIADRSGKLNWDLKSRKDTIGGLSVLGTFRGKFGNVSIDTYRMRPGTKFLYVCVRKDGKYQNFGERPMVLRICPPLPEMIGALQNASDEVLKSWGLEALQQAEQVMAPVDRRPARFDILFADGGKLRDVRIAGVPEVGRVLGVFSKVALEGIVRVDGLSGNTVSTSTRSDFLRGIAPADMTVAWVVKVRKHADSSPRRQLTATQERNLATYPEVVRGMMWEMATTSSGAITKSDGSVILTDSVTHLAGPFVPNTSGQIQLAYQVWTSQHEHWVPGPQEPEQWMPVAYTQYARVIKLSGSRTTRLVIDEAKITTSDRPGLFPGVAFIIGQAVRRPARVNVSNTANAPTCVDIDNTNNNSNSNTNVNDNANVVNVGEGSANGSANGEGFSDAYSGN